MRLQPIPAPFVSPLFILHALCVILFSPQAQAKVEVRGVIGASNVILPSMQNTSPTATPSPTASTGTKIYGGTAGVAATNARSANSAPFDTCKYAGKEGVAQLLSCNNQAIDGNVVLIITYVADKAGYPILSAPAGTSGTNVVTPYSSPGLVAAGATGSISFLWSSICNKMANAGQQVNGGNCQSNATTAGDMTFTLGIASSATATTADVDGGASIQILVADFVGSIAPDANGQSTTGRCEDEGTQGVCAFSIGNGDGKVILRNLYPGLSFPTGGQLPAWAVRLLWAPAANGENYEAFNNITAASTADNYRDLLLDQDQKGGAPSVAPGRVTGFTNEQWYVFKVAVVDWAKNVGLYTSSENEVDKYCLHSTGANDTSCHFGHPGEVVGVLSKDLTCFVATAAYGSQMAPQVEIFRRFRDIFLKPTAWGAKFVAWYYQHSPQYARMISQSETLRAIARWALTPALFFAWLSVNFGMMTAIVISVLILFSISAIVSAITMKARERRRQRGADCKNA